MQLLAGVSSSDSALMPRVLAHYDLVAPLLEQRHRASDTAGRRTSRHTVARVAARRSESSPPRSRANAGALACRATSANVGLARLEGEALVVLRPPASVPVFGT